MMRESRLLTCLLLAGLVAADVCSHCDTATARDGQVSAKQQQTAAAAADTSAEVPPSTNPATKPLAIVVWISVDGLRGDYVDRADAPFLKRMMAEGAYSRRSAPVFPTLTFPAHVSQCTGALVKDHGIIGNELYDLKNDKPWPYPNDNSAILCEPIWNTAKRQGLRVAVIDWPTSQNQTGPNAADYFDTKYNTGIPDERRLDRLWQIWASDNIQEPSPAGRGQGEGAADLDSPSPRPSPEGRGSKKPLQLLMGYFPGVDSKGHKFGPNSPEAKAAVEAADRLLAKSFELCQEIVKQKHGEKALSPRGRESFATGSRSDSPSHQSQKTPVPPTQLYFIVSTDHGMMDIHSLVSLKAMLGDALTPEMRSITSGSVANIYLDFVKDPAARRPLAENIVKTLDRYKFAKAYLRDEMPAEWGYGCAGRTGDVVVSLDPGHFFSDKSELPIQPVNPADGPLGMHGYPLDGSPEMFGFLAIWRSGEPIGGIDLGEIESRRLHATVAKMLGVEPAATALNEPLPGVVAGTINESR